MTDEYDYDQQVRDLVSSDPAVKQAAINRLRLRVEKIRNAGTETRRVVVIKRTVSVVTVSPVRNWDFAESSRKGESRRMTDEEIVAYEQGLDKEAQIMNLEEAVAYGNEANVTVDVTFEFLDEPVEVKR